MQGPRDHHLPEILHIVVNSIFLLLGSGVPYAWAAYSTYARHVYMCQGHPLSLSGTLRNVFICVDDSIVPLILIALRISSGLSCISSSASFPDISEKH